MSRRGTAWCFIALTPRQPRRGLMTMARLASALGWQLRLALGSAEAGAGVVRHQTVRSPSGSSGAGQTPGGRSCGAVPPSPSRRGSAGAGSSGRPPRARRAPGVQPRSRRTGGPGCPRQGWRARRPSAIVRTRRAATPMAITVPISATATVSKAIGTTPRSFGRSAGYGQALVPASSAGNPSGLAQAVEAGRQPAEIEAGAEHELVERGRLPSEGGEHRLIRWRAGPGGRARRWPGRRSRGRAPPGRPGRSRPGLRPRPADRWCPRRPGCGSEPGTAMTSIPWRSASSTVCIEPPRWCGSTTTTRLRTRR